MGVDIPYQEWGFLTRKGRSYGRDDLLKRWDRPDLEVTEVCEVINHSVSQKSEVVH